MQPRYSEFCRRRRLARERRLLRGHRAGLAGRRALLLRSAPRERVMRELALVGLVALVFGLGSYYATGQLDALRAAEPGGRRRSRWRRAAVLALRRLRFAAGSHSRRLLLRGLLGVAAALALAVALERAAAWSGLRATPPSSAASSWPRRRARRWPSCRASCGDALSTTASTRAPGTPGSCSRAWRSRAACRCASGCSTTAPEELERFEVAASNTVVLELGVALRDRRTTARGHALRGALPAARRRATA